MSACVHFWIIAEADGNRYSYGACRRCGESRRFDNWPPLDDIAARNLVNGAYRAHKFLTRLVPVTGREPRS